MPSTSSKTKTPSKRASRKSATPTKRIGAVTESLLAISGRSLAGDNSIREIISCLKNLVPFDAVTVFRISDDGKEMKPVFDEGDRVGMLDFVSIGSGGGLTGWSAETAKPVLLADRTRLSSYHPDTDYASFLSFPVTIKDRVVAIINFGARKAGAFSKDHADHLDQVLLPLAFSVENVFLKEDLRRLKRTSDEIERSLSQSRDSSAVAQSLATIIDLATETNHIVNEALSVIVGNVQCLLMENAAENQKGIARLRRVESAAMNINECNRKLLRIAALVEKASQLTQKP
jgi:transcriptional regulator with GAF, ATPase, and Fis domain